MATLCPEASTFNLQDSNVAKAENCICSGSRTNLIWSWDGAQNFSVHLLDHRHFPGSKVKRTSGKIKRPNLQMNTLMLVHCLGQSKANWCQLSSVLRILNIVIEILNHKNTTNRISFLFPSALPSPILRTNCNEIVVSGFVLVAVAGTGEVNKLVSCKMPA